MASLFDLWDPPAAPEAAPETQPETALGILDDALRSLHAARPLGLPAARSVGDLDARLALYRAREQPPPSSQVQVEAATSAADGRRAADADVAARDALRALGEELALLRVGRGADADAKQAAAMLTRRFAAERLDALPDTPFVLLARRKARLQIDALRTPPAAAKPTAKAAAKVSDSDDWRRRASSLLELPPTRLAALRRLAALPEAQRRRLPAAQRELAAFAGRLDALLALPEPLAQRLPADHRRLLDALRRRMAGGDEDEDENGDEVGGGAS